MNNCTIAPPRGAENTPAEHAGADIRPLKKRLLTIQDISCLGKCSLTVALPVISALGVETAVLPTAMLSTHTMFDGFTYLDLTSQMDPITDHWKKESITFDTIYTGYLGSTAQMELVRKIIRKFQPPAGHEKTLIVIDPVMADYGRLYSGFTESYAAENARFCGCADVILPNLTEAHFLTGLPYRESGSYGKQYILDMLKALCKLGSRFPAVTGVSFSDETVGVMAMSRDSGQVFEYFTDRVPVGYHGTGDLFASVVAGSLTRESGPVSIESLGRALRLAVDYTQKTIEVTYLSGGRDAAGVDFEATLPLLMQRE